jgi:DNA-binding transcriptional regulator YiaG
MKINILIFEKLLAKENITKKYFAQYADIPYYTVAGWKKNNKVPNYAMTILKDIIYRKKLNIQANIELKK